MATAKLIAITRFAAGMIDEIALKEAEYQMSDMTNASEIERLTAYIARVSNPNNQLNPNVEGLLTHCIENEHWSVFEHGYLTIEVGTMAAIATQILRHRSFTFQQFSQRYANVTKNKQGMFVPFKFRRQDKKNRQNSIDDFPEWHQAVLQHDTSELLEKIQNYYDYLIESGVAKEVARFILPQCTATELEITGNIRSWIHYTNLRTHPSTQLEHREVALACRQILINELPIISKACGWI